MAAMPRIGRNVHARARSWRRRAGLVWVLLAMQLALPALAETPRPPRGAAVLRELTVVNRGNRPVHELRVSPSDADQWGDDRLGDDTLPAGGSFRVRLGRTRDCRFDVQVIYDDASREEQRGVDVCRRRTVTFDRSAVVLPPEPFAVDHRVTLENRTQRRIDQVFLSPGTADRWGDDLAPPGGIAPGTSGVIAYRGGCAADLRLVYDNRSAEERRELDICTEPTLLIEPGWTLADAPPVPPRPPPAQDSLVLLNGTGSTITELYLRPEDPALPAQGGDVLGNAVLPAGGRLIVTFDRGLACRFVAHIRHGGDRAEQTQLGIDICASRTIALEPGPRG